MSTVIIFVIVLHLIIDLYHWDWIGVLKRIVSILFHVLLHFLPLPLHWSALEVLTECIAVREFFEAIGINLLGMCGGFVMLAWFSVVYSCCMMHRLYLLIALGAEYLTVILLKCGLCRKKIIWRTYYIDKRRFEMIDESTYFAGYRIGGSEVRIFDTNGCGHGSFCLPGPIICPAALGPHVFVFITDHGPCVIDAPAGILRYL